MPEYMMKDRVSEAAARQCMQCTLIADGLKRLGRDTLEYLQEARCFPEIWSPGLLVRKGRLLPLRFHFNQVGDVWTMSWCDDAGNHAGVDKRMPLYVTVTYAGKRNQPFANQVGAAIERMLANKNYTLLDYRQYESVQRLVASGRLLEPAKGTKK